MVRRGGQSIVLAGVRGPGTVEQVEQVVSESAVVGEGGTVDSPGRRTGARDGGAGRARVQDVSGDTIGRLIGWGHNSGKRLYSLLDRVI